MIKVENIDFWGFEHAIRGMRNPLNSWAKSDSLAFGTATIYADNEIVAEMIGPNDLTLMKTLYQAGPEHRKYLRQIFVSMDITAPLYWWKEFDTYKVGTVANSCSTMHTIHRKEFTLDDFSCEHLINGTSKIMLNGVIDLMNQYRSQYLNTKNKEYWWQLIQLLPSSYNQKRTVTMNYENVATIIRQRSHHKLDEWNNFIDILKELPYVKEIMEESKEDKVNNNEPKVPYTKAILKV